MKFFIQFLCLMSAMLISSACHSTHRFSPTSSDDDGPFKPSDPLNYQTINNKIFQLKCMGCHHIRGNSGAEEVLFGTYEELMNDPQKRWEGTPGESSRGVQALTRSDDDPNRMPPPDTGEPRLSEDEIKFITRWIDAGRSEF